MDSPKLIKPIEIALQMENDGWNFYMESSKKTSDESIKKMLISLARDEENHICIFKKVYESIKNFNKWPDDVFVAFPDNLKSVFDTNKNENQEKAVSAKNDLDIIKIAMDMENKSYEN